MAYLGEKKSYFGENRQTCFKIKFTIFKSNRKEKYTLNKNLIRKIVTVFYILNHKDLRIGYIIIAKLKGKTLLKFDLKVII